MSLINDNIRDFITCVNSSEPVPGGGSVSALCGALAAALAGMVARLTAGRKKYADVEAEMLDAIDTLGPHVDALIADIDRDSDAYAAVMNAFRMPKDTDEQKSARSAAINQATRNAALVPLQVAQRVADILPYIELVALKGNSNACTDACVAAMCASTAIRGALLNVRINLSSIDDPDFVNPIAAKADELHDIAVQAEKRILNLPTLNF